MTNWDYYEAALRFQRILDAEGVTDALRESGAKEGDLIMIGECGIHSFSVRHWGICLYCRSNIHPNYYW